MPLPWLTDALDDLHRKGLVRHPRVLQAATGPETVVDGKKVLLFCSNDYLGLAGRPEVRDAARRAIADHGVGTCSSRLVSGTHAFHRELEERLAAWLGVERTLLLPAGFMANLAVLGALVEADDVIFSDELNHASIVQGCRLARGRTVVYPHKDVAELGRLLAQHENARRRFIVTDAIFSVDGDAAPVADIHRLAQEHAAALIVDEAHSLGVLGPRGRGLCAASQVSPDVLVGTFGKAFGCVGAFVGGPSELIEYLESRAVPHIYTTAPPPALAAAASAALTIVEGADDLREQLAANAARLRAAFDEIGCSIGNGGASHIVPALVPGIARAVAVSEELFRRGLFVQALRPPTVSAGTERLRWTPTSLHTTAQIDRGAAIFAQVLETS